MEKRYETRHIFLALGICLALSSLIAMVIIPQAVVNTAHKTSETWHVFTSRENYVLCLIGFGLFVLAFFLIYWLDIKLVPILISLVIVAASAGVFFLSARSYKAFSEEGIEVGYWNSPQQYTYSWSDVERVFLHNNAGEGKLQQYQFTFADGEEMFLERNRYVSYMEMMLRDKLKREKIPIENIY